MTQRPPSNMMAALIAMSAVICTVPVFAQSPAVTTASPKAASAAVVSQYRYNTAHTGYTEANLTLPLTVLWRNTSEPLKGSAASPVYSDGTVYFSAGKHIYAMRADDGTLAWQYPAAKKAGSDDSSDTAETGVSYNTTPALADGFVYVGSDSAELIKFNAKTGEKIWTSKVEGAVRSSPLIDSGTVYFGSDDSHCYAVSAATGKRIWATATDAAVNTSPLMAGGAVVVGCADNTLVAMSSATGHRTWTAPVNGDPRVSPPAYSDNIIFSGSGSEVVALSARGGAIRWKRPITSEASTPVTVGLGSVFIASQDGQLSAFTDHGRVKWTTTLDYPSFGIPLLTNDTLLVPTQRGIVYAYSPETGSLKWEYIVHPASTAKGERKTTVDIHTSPILADNTLFILSDDGTLSAFRANAPDAVPPRVTATVPGPGKRVGGARIPYEITMVDDGTGIDPSTVSLRVDGSLVANTKFDASKNALVMVVATDQDATVTTALKDGVHQATLVAADWRGNKVTHTWGFSVDNKLNPKGMKFTIQEQGADQQPAPPTKPGPPSSRVITPRPGTPPAGGNSNEPPPPPPFPAL